MNPKLRLVCGAITLIGLTACGVPGAGSPPGQYPTSTAMLDPESTAKPDLTERRRIDQPDEVEGYMVHFMYVVPSDGADRDLDVNGTIENSVGSFQLWLMERTGGTRLRVDTVGGELDVTFVRLARRDADIAKADDFVVTRIEESLHAAGFNDPNKLYAVYYDGTSTISCGAAPSPPGLIGNTAAQFLQGLPDDDKPCNSLPFVASPGSTPGYVDLTILHEIFHTLGVVPECAPHRVELGHVDDSSSDLMYSGPLPWEPDTVDFGRDDYWGHSNAGCLDVSKSIFLDPLPEDARLPPGWPASIAAANP